MDIQTRKINFVQEYLRIRNISLIVKLERILREEKAIEYEKNLEPLSVINFNSIIDNSLNDAKHGRVIEVNELKEISKKWK